MLYKLEPSAGGMDITSTSIMDITSGGIMNIITSGNNSNITINPHGTGTLALGSLSNTAITLDSQSFSIDLLKQIQYNISYRW